MPENKRSLGTLILASNSLGLPIDVPARSLDVLRQSDLLVFEEDRPARQALKAAGIHRDYLKLTEHREKDTIDAVTKALQEGKTVCYMSDQGMPTIADPGQALLEIAYNFSYSVQVIPGPSSITTALAACPFSVDQFIYQGFLPRDTLEREQYIEELARNLKHPVVILETPYRRKQLIQALAQGLGGHHRALLAIDISGPEELYCFKTLDSLAQLDLGKLNFVLVLEGKTPSISRRPLKKR